MQIEDILKDDNIEYYLNPDLTESDFIRKEFSKLTSRAGHYETNAVLKTLERINRVIEKRLNNNCIKHYGNIAKGLKNIESLGDDNIVSLTKIYVVRNIIKTIKEQVTQNSINIIRLKKQNQNAKIALQNIENILQIVGKRFKIIQDVQIDKNSFQFLKCDIIYKNLREIESIVQENLPSQLQGINAFKNIEVMVKNKYKIVTEIVMKNWSILHKNYEEECLYNNLLSQFILERRQEIQALETIKHQQLIDISDEIIIETVKENVFADNFDENNMLCNFNYISRDRFLPFLQKIFSQFTKLMVNYHYISRWFVKYDSNESTQFLQTDWADNLLDDETLLPHEQRDIFLQYVQQKKNIYLQDRKMLWQTIEHKVRQIINNTYQINGFTENELIIFLKLTSDFIGTGIQYSNSESENIRQCVNQKIVSYYQQFIINFQSSIQTSLNEENWEQVDSINYLQLQSDLYKIINTPLQKEFINSIQYILPELKVENIESYSPQNNSKYNFSTPNIRTDSMTHLECDNQDEKVESSLPEVNLSTERIDSDINLQMQTKRIDFKLIKCESQQTPIRDNQQKSEMIVEEDSKFIHKIKILSMSTLRMINGIMNSLRLIKILWPVQYSIYEAMMELIDYYVTFQHFIIIILIISASLVFLRNITTQLKNR